MNTEEMEIQSIEISSEPEETADTREIEKVRDFPIVGIGASAGGLAAFEAFFKGAPQDVDLNMSIVLIQHLAPDHKSILAEIVKRFTDMKVYEVTEAMKVKPNCVYIIPPNRNMALINGTLQLFETALKRGHNTPIDFFFKSLASDKKDKAICVILSGTGSDGTIGLRAVKDECGMAMVQSPEKAEYDGMPISAIRTELEDYQLPPEQMIHQILTYMDHKYINIDKPHELSDSKMDDLFRKIFILLRSETGHDFSDYKLKTIRRRIERRLSVNNIELLEDYVKFLEKTPTEIQALFNDLLIGVTTFFRDEHAFQALEEELISELFKTNKVGSTIRIWCVGCSTGEEAYSIAIMMQEALEKVKKGHHIQVFATDIDKEAIASARIGLYPCSISANVSPERLDRFFSLESTKEHYRINNTIRDLLVFSEHSVIKDPPFSKLDLIVCRNVLIYMKTDSQNKIISLFNYALKDKGGLFLGSSETIGDNEILFSTLNKRDKIYRKNEDFGVNKFGMTNFAPSSSRIDHRDLVKKNDKQGSYKEPLRDLIEKAILSESHLVGALVNEHGDILYIHGSTGSFFELPTGQSGVNNILNIARDGLRLELRKAFHHDYSLDEKVSIRDIHVKVRGYFIKVNLKIKRLRVGYSKEGKHLFAVILEEVAVPGDGLVKGISLPRQNMDESDMSLDELRLELKIKESNLEASNSELELVNQELKSYNEELQSINEELQSTNEELETSKEELQSINEELSTVNAESQDKVDELSRVNNDMNNLLSGTNIATLFLDYQLDIMRFTPAIVQIINLIPADVGRSIEDISFNIRDNNDFLSNVKEVLDTLIPKSYEVQSMKGLWYNMAIQPYRTIDNVIEGAVVTYIDITESKHLSAQLEISEAKYRSLFEGTREGVMLLNDQGVIQEVNPYLVDLLGFTKDEFLDKAIWDIGQFKDIIANKRNFQTLIDESYIRYKNLPLETYKGNKIEVEFVSNSYKVKGKTIIQCSIRE